MKKIRNLFVALLVSGTAVASYAATTTCKNGVPDGPLPSNCVCEGDRIKCTFN